MIGLCMRNVSKRLKSFSCETHGKDKNVSVCDTCVGIRILPCVTHILGYSYLWDMARDNLIYERCITNMFTWEYGVRT